MILVLNGMTSMHQRAEESERLMEWAFREFEDVTLFTAGDVVERAPVWLGSSPTVPLVGGRDLVVTMPRNWRKKPSGQGHVRRADPGAGAQGDALGKLSVSGQGVPAWTCRCWPARTCRGSACRAARSRWCRTTSREAEPMRGRFITLEGGEGAASPPRRACWPRRWRRAGMPVLRTREPGGAPGAERLRALLLSGEVDWSPEAEVLLHFAARAEHVGTHDPPRAGGGDAGSCATGSPIRRWRIRGTGKGRIAGLIATLAGWSGLRRI